MTSSPFVVFLTGLSAAGKSTIAHALLDQLSAAGAPPITRLDGDVVRASRPGLGFSPEDRRANVRRIGEMALESAAQGHAVVCALIAPYDDVRRQIRRRIEAVCPFVLVYLSTPLSVCQARDPKGLYAKAAAGEIQQFTGVTAPYEVPSDAELSIDTADIEVDAAAGRVLDYLRRQGLIPPDQRG